MISRRHADLLEKELAFFKNRCSELEGENRRLIDTMFAVQGAPPPFQEPASAYEPVEDRKDWGRWQAELEAETGRVGSEEPPIDN